MVGATAKKPAQVVQPPPICTESPAEHTGSGSVQRSRSGLCQSHANSASHSYYTQQTSSNDTSYAMGDSQNHDRRRTSTHQPAAIPHKKYTNTTDNANLWERDCSRKCGETTRASHISTARPDCRSQGRPVPVQRARSGLCKSTNNTVRSWARRDLCTQHHRRPPDKDFSLANRHSSRTRLRIHAHKTPPLPQVCWGGGGGYWCRNSG